MHNRNIRSTLWGVSNRSHASVCSKVFICSCFFEMQITEINYNKVYMFYFAQSWDGLIFKMREKYTYAFFSLQYSPSRPELLQRVAAGKQRLMQTNLRPMTKEVSSQLPVSHQGLIQVGKTTSISEFLCPSVGSKLDKLYIL